jgi:hypothetical protein
MMFGLATLATYRMAHDLVDAEGPFRIYELWRNLFLSNNWLGRGVRCYVCMSFWTAFVFAVIVYLLGYFPLSDIFLVWPGLAGAALLLWRQEKSR